MNAPMYCNLLPFLTANGPRGTDLTSALKSIAKANASAITRVPRKQHYHDSSVMIQNYCNYIYTFCGMLSIVKTYIAVYYLFQLQMSPKKMYQIFYICKTIFLRKILQFYVVLILFSPTPALNQPLFFIFLSPGFIPVCMLGLSQVGRINLGQNVSSLRYFAICGLQEGFEPFAINMKRDITMWFSKSLPQFVPVATDHNHIEVSL